LPQNSTNPGITRKIKDLGSQFSPPKRIVTPVIYDFGTDFRQIYDRLVVKNYDKPSLSAVVPFNHRRAITNLLA
jgi:hypothetical protein